MKLLALLTLLSASVTLGGCSASGQTRAVELETLSSSGVTGTVNLVDVGGDMTRVDISVQPGGNNDMPAHIHPGSCTQLVPQPEYPLQNVVNGISTTVVPAPLSELIAGDLAVNLHRSNEDLATYTACADLR
ncbi:MAG TPA: hypothetical protein VEX62_01390 [Candidatus Limnocylindrales bacterium]|nr:hypothetical protein [Candidatus Limnocylindrales bacterium]